jgi:hypothetical protein
MKFRQKKGRYKTSFEFGEEDLTYTFDSGTKVGSTVPYHKIPERTGYREVRPWWLKYFTVFYLTLCAITIIYYMSLNDLDGLFRTVYFATLIFLCVCLVGLRRRGGGMTSFPLNPALVILHDGQQQAIINEIMKRRLAMMKIKVAQVDSNRPYYEEAGKFSWLKEEGVISEQEYREARKKIAAMRDKAAHAPHNPGHLN